MSALFAFNVSKPIEATTTEDPGTYDADTQVWTGHERSVAATCTKHCGYSGYQTCRATSTSCSMSGYTSTSPMYACIWIKCD